MYDEFNKVEIYILKGGGGGGDSFVKVEEN